jgi:hypothetical protein
MYYFKYVEELENVTPIAALEEGRTYHSKLEQLYKNGDFDIDVENPKISAMAIAYQKYIYPQFKVQRVEDWFEYQIDQGVTLVGRYDGVADDGCVVEHKSTSADVDDEYIYNLQWDEQVLNYMLTSGKNEIYYTVCKKPTIRQKQNETAEQFLDRCVEWYDEDTDKKIRVIKVIRNEKEIEAQKVALKYIARSMVSDEECYELWSSQLHEKELADNVFYRNCCHCTAFGRKCEFASICLDYDPKLEYVEYKKKEYKE